MARTPLWSAIAETLGAEIGAGRYAAGDRLPPEVQLAARFGVNRHTLRRAVATLARRGLVEARQGAGVFVTAGRRIAYPLGRRVRFQATLAAQGARAQRTILGVETRRADAAEAEALAIAPGGRVHAISGVSHADGVPVAVFRSVFPAERLKSLPAALAETASITAALGRLGVADYTRARTEISAATADAAQALRLRLAEGAALIVTRGVNIDPEGRPVELGETWFAADRVVLTVAPEDGGFGR
jgi:GntR family phosphonate transport system transcriptional regulator